MATSGAGAGAGVKVAGADVWKGRWVVVVLRDGRFERALVAATMRGVLDATADVAAIGVDIPIGLAPRGRRRPSDVLARYYVGPRWHSVFMTPPAELLEAGSHAEANDRARSEGWDGISAQMYALRGPVFQVGPYAARDPRIHEVHPEVSFCRANDGQVLRWPKSSWSGAAVRRRILERHGIVIPDDLGPPGGAGAADVLDAAAAAWSASRIAAGRAEALPADADRIGAIWR